MKGLQVTQLPPLLIIRGSEIMQCNALGHTIHLGTPSSAVREQRYGATWPELSKVLEASRWKLPSVMLTQHFALLTQLPEKRDRICWHGTIMHNFSL